MKKTIMFTILAGLSTSAIFGAATSYLSEDAQGDFYVAWTKGGGGHILIQNISNSPITLVAKITDTGEETGRMVIAPGEDTGEQRFSGREQRIYCYTRENGSLKRIACQQYTLMPEKYKDDTCWCGTCGGKTDLGMQGACL